MRHANGVRRVFATALALVAYTGEIGAQAAPAWATRLDSLVRDQLASTNTPGAQVAVTLNGRVILSRAYGVADIESGRAVTPQTLFRVGSVTKMVTAAALLQLASQGKLDLQSPVARYVPQLEGRQIGAVTTHQLLTHNAGFIDNAVAYGRMGEGALGEVMREITDTLLFVAPGRIYSYSNPGYSLAGYVAERASGQRFGDVVSEQVLRPLRMPLSTFRPLEAMTRDFAQGHIGPRGRAPVVVRPYTENTAQWAAGFLFASAEELARFAIAVIDSGRIDGEQVLSPSTIAAMTTGHVDIPDGSGARYGYGLRVQRYGDHRLWAHGGSINGFDARVTMFPDRRLAIIVLNNGPQGPLSGIVDLVAREVAAIAAPQPPVVAAYTPDAATRQSLVGSYAQGNVRVTIEAEGDSLTFARGMQRGVVQFLSPSRIRLTSPMGPPIIADLVRDSAGRVEFLHQGGRAQVRQP